MKSVSNVFTIEITDVASVLKDSLKSVSANASLRIREKMLR